ncbi:hypothetical protein VNO78_32104 [Psophocarpus tetragonolobus]|uniref:Uncharacterized protein n=1 Tax=Psophocarpus tetragonolobus TaxID=3891 RepID=A0AAN9S018_PSOTE
MGRQGNDPTTVNSSIALLQERFRQLEKVKERREGKQLLKLLSSETTSPTIMHNPTSPNSQSQPRLVLPHTPNLHDSLSLGLNLTNKQADHNTMNMKPPPSSNLWPQGASTSINFDISDVDTSLHL